MIQTKASLLKQAAECKIVKFTERKRVANPNRPKFKKPEEVKEEIKSRESDEEFEAVFGDGPSRKRKTQDNKNEFSFIKAKKEIINYAIAGFEKSDKLDAQVQLAIKLKAKPPKNPARNYKEIMEEKKRQKKEESKTDKRNMFGASRTLQLNNQKKNKKDEGLLKRYGKVEKGVREKIEKSGKKRKRQ